MKINIIEKALGSGLFTGYIPFASGTFGSLAALFIYLIPGFENKYLLIPIIIITAIAGIFIGNKFEEVYGKDPGECTIDEFAGMWISLLLIPKDFYLVVTVFFIWRFFDIVKVFPANSAEKLKGGLGIMLDDIISGLYAMAAGYILTLIFY